jgi:hypothetical protein
MDRGANVFLNVLLRAWRPTACWTAYRVACWFRQAEMKATPTVSEEMSSEARDLILELLADGEWHSHRQILGDLIRTPGC